MIQHVTIIGVGAIGQLWAHHLASQHVTVSLVGRRKQPSPLNITMEDVNGTQSSHEFPYYCGQLPKRNDLVIVTTKAYQVAEALSPFLTQLITTPIILLHNGLGSVEQLNFRPSQPVLLATTSHGAFKSDDRVHHTGVGQTTIGALQNISQSTAKEITTVLNNALAQVNWVDDISKFLWLKLAINCVINPLTALNHCNNGQLAKPEYQQQIQEITSELNQLFIQLNIDLSIHEIQQAVAKVIKNTADNYSSMHQDLIHHRQTEIDNINGYVVKKAQQLGLDLPQNEKLWRSVSHYKPKS